MFQNCCNLFKVYPHIAWTNVEADGFMLVDDGNVVFDLI